ncbi:hypothetical protein [Candidatus Mesenet endosymbiont of Phosphuga atrata]|uniref:hypothetical protein n=1 Tax=Candidatus Mesenet endosymbiont of Phosphuga atrata TaxID=3066221 RepID=UPI0030D07831
MPGGSAAEIDIEFFSNKEGKTHITSPPKPKSLFGWYDSEFIKASLGDITTNEYANKEANAIIIVQSEAYESNNDKESDKEFIKNVVSEEFSQALMLLKQTKLSVCFIRSIPHYDEGYEEKITEHYIFLYFFRNHNHKKSVLIIDPQGSKFGTDQNEKAIDEEFVDIIYYAAKKSGAKLYVSEDVIQQDGRSCGPICVELVRAFYEIDSDEGKKERLFEILKKNEPKPGLFDYFTSKQLYRLCKLGTDIIPQNVIDDFSIKEPVTFVDGNHEDVGGEKTREKHHNTTASVDKKKKYLKESYFISHIKPFLIKLGADPNLLDLEKLCPSFKSGIITGAEILDQVKTSKNAVDTPEAKGKKKDKRKKSLIKKDNKRVTLQLADGQIKNPYTQLSNEEKRDHQHTRKNIKRIADEDHNEYTEIQSEECLQKFNPCLTLLIAVCISGSILSSMLLLTGNNGMSIGKMINIGILATSSITLVCTISVVCFVKNKEQKVAPKIDDPNIQAELQQTKSYN